MRRLQCENVDADPIVWTNQRFIRWARSIDLGEYADNLKGTQPHEIVPSNLIRRTTYTLRKYFFLYISNNRCFLYNFQTVGFMAAW